MKNILVTTDFSNNSQAAILYAVEIAKKFNAQLEVFNSFVTVPAIGIDGGPGIINKAVMDSGVEANYKRIKELVKNLPENLTKGVQIFTRVTSGDPVIAICEYAKEQEIDLIVMGTHGESRIEEILFGGTTIDVIKQANCPVLAIPPDCNYYNIKRIVYASDLEEKDITVIKHLTDLAKFFDAEVLVFHSFDEDNMTIQEEANEFNQMLHKSVTYDKLKTESKTYANSFDAILEAIKKDLANLIVMREKKRSIFSRLFHPDLVKKINYHTTIPLLTYNDNSLLKEPNFTKDQLSKL